MDQQQHQQQQQQQQQGYGNDYPHDPTYRSSPPNDTNQTQSSHTYVSQQQHQQQQQSTYPPTSQQQQQYQQHQPTVDMHPQQPYAHSAAGGNSFDLQPPNRKLSPANGGDYDSLYDSYAYSNNQHPQGAHPDNSAASLQAGGGGGAHAYGASGGAYGNSEAHLVKHDAMYDGGYGFAQQGPGYDTIELGRAGPGGYPPTQTPMAGAPDLPPHMGGAGMPQPPPPGMPQAQPWSGLGLAPGTAIATGPYGGGGPGGPRYGAGMPAGPISGNYAANRERLMRKRTVRRIELQDGNLVLDVPVPKSIARQGQAEEFTKMRYTAVTCKPDEYIRERYTTRAWLKGRKTELMIVLTMYNEDEVLFCRTMNNVIKNIAHLCTRSRSKTWGPQAWEKVVVVIVSDGRKKANERTLKVLGLMGCYVEGVMKDHVIDKPTQAHVFEYTSQVVVDAKGNVKVGTCPVQIIFCLKEKNQKKLNSHRWFFNAFAAQLQPNVCVLLDVGTKPTGTSIYELWKAFDKHPNVGGACGEICVDTGKGCGLLINPLVASQVSAPPSLSLFRDMPLTRYLTWLTPLLTVCAVQNFEYKISNILDKPLESVFGYISVLPGAFSAYRFKALRGRPLEAYFKGEAMHMPGAAPAGTFTSNMYLAEDRILCFEITAKAGEAWVLQYVKSAKASTDVPDRVPEFISQRRRWLNGSLFAGIHATLHFYRIWSSGHNFFRKLWLQVQVIYNVIQLVFTWTALANFFLAFYFLITSATSEPENDPFGGQGDAILEVMQNVYIAMLVVCIVCSLGNRPQGSNLAYTSVIIIFAAIMGIALYCAGWTTYLALKQAGLTSAAGWTGENISHLFGTAGFRDIVISLAATYVLWFVASILHFEPWHMITSFVQYLFLTPTYGECSFSPLPVRACLDDC
jgi:chitin synthase